ncbi:MAG TPA: SpoIIE family protein phosphatase [Rhodocyclaceae bacterium]|nr:SpoIIE family protein phosphatase [Rhodocyclaceae bacterium]
MSPIQPSNVSVNMPLRVLLAEPQPALREALLDAPWQRAAGGDPVLRAVSNGRDLLTGIAEFAPDVVITRSDLPALDAFEVCARLKKADTRHRPAFLFIVDTEDEVLACMARDQTEFVRWPLPLAVLVAKVGALAQRHRREQAVSAALGVLQAEHESLLEEVASAERAILSAVRGLSRPIERLRVRNSPSSIASGDLLLGAAPRNGEEWLLFGDFSGHGLLAAAGALTVAEIFSAMSQKGLPVDSILREMNRKLHARLPVGMFFAACLLRIDRSRQHVDVWNCGMPDALLVHLGNGLTAPIIERFGSNNLPLGIVPDTTFTSIGQSAAWNTGDRLYAYSDGILESTNWTDDAFGNERVLATLATAAELPDQGDMLAALCQVIWEHRQGRRQQDDVTVFELELTPGTLRADLREQVAANSSTMLRGTAPAVSLSAGPEEFNNQLCGNQPS